MVAKAKKEESQDKSEQNENQNIAVVIGSCAVKFKGELYSNGKEFEITEEDLKLPGIRYMFGNGHLMFKNQYERTKDFVEAFRDKRLDKEAGKTTEELEKGAEYK